MIIYPQSLLLSELLTQPLTHPRIGWHTYTFDLDALDVTVSGETADGPRDAPLQPETVQFWEPPSLPATWDLDFGALRELDYVGLVANLGSVGCAVEARISEDVADFNDYLSLSGVDANYASTPDSVANSVTGDLHLELELAIDNADLPDFSLDFMGDFTASMTKITDDGIFTRAGNTATRGTSAGLVASVLADVPRQDFNPMTRAIRGLLIEESRINLCLRTEDFSNASWTKARVTISTNAANGADGAATADKIVLDNTAGEHYVEQNFTAAAGTWTHSFFVKAAELTRGFLTAVHVGDPTTTSAVLFNLAAGTIASAGAPVTNTAITPFPNGVYRIEMTFTTTASVSSLRSRLQLSDAAGNIAFTGDNVSGMYVWGAQFEAGATATSYIPATAGSTVTRAADAVTTTDLTAMAFNATEGTFIFASEYANSVAADQNLFSVDNGTANERFNPFRRATTGVLDHQIIDGGVTQCSIAVGAIASAAVAKAALAYKLNDATGSLEGAATQSDVSVTLPTVTTLRYGCNVNGVLNLNGWLREFFYYATRRVDATLQDFSRQTYRVLASKWAETSNQRSWALCLKENCALVLFVSTDGTAAGIREYHSAPLTFTEGLRFRIRVQLDIISGADSVCTFQTSDDDGDTWDTVGSAITQASVSAIFNSTAPVEVGSFNGGTSEFQGKMFQFWLHATLADGPVIHFDAAEGETGDTTIVSEDTGETWTIHSTGPATALKIKRFAAPIAPGDDAPIMMLDDLRSARRLRLRFTGTTPPRLAVVYAGEALAMEREVDGSGFVPLTLSRETELTQPLSRGGQFLGQSFKRFGVKSSAGFRHLDPAWYRANFDPFVEHARRYPYFFAWWPEEYPEEVGFVWTNRDIAPSYMGVREWMQVNWDMHGIGNE